MEGSPNSESLNRPIKITGLSEAAMGKPFIGGRDGGSMKLILAGVNLENNDVVFDFDPKNPTSQIGIEVIGTPVNILLQAHEVGTPLPPSLIGQFQFPSGMTSEQKRLILKRAHQHNQAVMDEYKEQGGDLSLLPKVNLPKNPEPDEPSYIKLPRSKK